MSLKSLVYKSKSSREFSMDATPGFPDLILSKFHLSRDFHPPTLLRESGCVTIIKNEAKLNWANYIFWNCPLLFSLGWRVIVMHKSSDHKNRVQPGNSWGCNMPNYLRVVNGKNKEYFNVKVLVGKMRNFNHISYHISSKKVFKLG